MSIVAYEVSYAFARSAVQVYICIPDGIDEYTCVHSIRKILYTNYLVMRLSLYRTSQFSHMNLF